MNWHPKAENWSTHSAHGAFAAEYEQFLMWSEGHFNIDRRFYVGNEHSSIHEPLRTVFGIGADGNRGLLR